MIRFACPGCGATYSVDDAKGGKTGKCPKCQTQFQIPAPDGAPAPPPVTAADSRVSLPPPPPADPNAPVEIAPCPGCQARLSVATSDLGADVECPYCKTVYPAVRADAAPSPSKVRAAVADEGRPSRHRRGEEDDRPSRRGRNEDDAEERPRYRRRRDEDDYRPRRRGKPGTVTAVGGMLLGGGIYALVQSILLVLFSTGICCLWPGVYLGLVWGVLAIIRGAAILGHGPRGEPPRTLLILQIVLILNFDVINCVLGIVGLVLLNNPEVRDYYDRRGYND